MISPVEPIMKYLIPLLALCASATASAADRLPPGAAFSGMPAGAAPTTPWIARAKGTATVKRESPSTLANASQNWVRFTDTDGVEGVSLSLTFPEIKKGIIRFKLHFPEGPGTIGMYLGTAGASKAESRVVDFKAMESGLVHVGSKGERTRTELKVVPGDTLALAIHFSEEANGEAIKLYTETEGGTPTMIHEQTFPTGGGVTDLRIATDTKTAATNVYVGDLSLESVE